jgi:hypothetical protein
VKVKLLQWAMDQAPGSEMDVSPNIAALLIKRGAAEAVDLAEASRTHQEVPARNKSMAARQRRE